MRHPAILAGLGLLAASGLPAFAQQALDYVQPLAPQEVQSVQARLHQEGFYAGRIDGVWGADSETALQRFQQTHQLQVTGQLNQATAATLGLDPNALVMASAPHSQPAADQLRPASVSAIQSRLRALNFYSGVVDGVWGPATESALVRYQQANRLQPTGDPNPATMSAMGLSPDVLAYR